MIDVQIIDNTESIHHCIDGKGLSVSVFDDEIKALNAAESLKPSVIVLNYGLRQNGTAEYIALLNNVSADSKIVLIAPKLTDDEVMIYLIAGAQGYLEAAQLKMHINKVIKVIHQGEAWISRRMTAKVLEKIRS